MVLLTGEGNGIQVGRVASGRSIAIQTGHQGKEDCGGPEAAARVVLEEGGSFLLIPTFREKVVAPRAAPSSHTLTLASPCASLQEGVAPCRAAEPARFLPDHPG